MLTAEELSRREGYMSVEEVVALKEVALTLPPNSVVINIGAGMGTSALAFLELENNLHVYSIDIEDDSQFGSLRREREALEEAGFWPNDRIEQIHGDSRQIGREWDKGFVDLVFVDDGHYYEHCRGDIEAWMPHIWDSGLIVFHDFGGPYDIGVSRAVNEMMFDHKQISHVDSLIAFRIER